MISATTPFMDKVNNGDVPMYRMRLLTADGTIRWIEEGQFWEGGISFSAGTSSNGSFDIGAAVIGCFNFSLNNFNGDFDDVDLKGAIVNPYAYYTINNEMVAIPKGQFYVATHKTSGHIINCTALDGLKLFDQSNTSIVYPVTVESLIRYLALENNITVADSSIPNGSYVIQEDPGTTMTDRQKLSYACQITGNYAMMNGDGELHVGWYDFQNPVSLSTTFDGKDLWTEPITITGLAVTITIDDDADVEDIIDGTSYEIGVEVTVKDKDVTFLYGTDDYVIYIKDNPYINAGNLIAIGEAVGLKVTGHTIRPGSLPILSNPCIEAGDVLQITDRVKDYTYLLPVTNFTSNRLLTQLVTCDFEAKEFGDLRPSSEYNIKKIIEQTVDQYYTWIAYADDATGTGISLDPTGKSYMGIAVNRLTETPDITDATVYKWSKRGADVFYGTCDTAASTADKNVVCADVTALYAGLNITVKFTNASTASALRLQINSLGYKNVYFGGANASSSNLFIFGAGSEIQFVYNGSVFIPVGHPCSYYGNSATVANTTSKDTIVSNTQTVLQAVVCKGTTATITFTYENTAASPTLNVGATGAKAIYANGSRPTADSPYNWDAGATVTFAFDGRYWRMQDTTPIGRAATALTTANGKNTVYYQGTQPTGGTYVAGDTWFDTAHGNLIYEFNGTNWETSHTFGTEAIQDLAITNAKVAALDAGKIQTGELSTILIRSNNNDYWNLSSQDITKVEEVDGVDVTYVFKGNTLQTNHLIAEDDIYIDGGPTTYIKIPTEQDELSYVEFSDGGMKVQATALDGINSITTLYPSDMAAVVDVLNTTDWSWDTESIDDVLYVSTQDAESTYEVYESLLCDIYDPNGDYVEQFYQYANWVHRTKSAAHNIQTLYGQKMRSDALETIDPYVFPSGGPYGDYKAVPTTANQHYKSRSDYESSYITLAHMENGAIRNVQIDADDGTITFAGAVNGSTDAWNFRLNGGNITPLAKRFYVHNTNTVSSSATWAWLELASITLPENKTNKTIVYKITGTAQFSTVAQWKCQVLSIWYDSNHHCRHIYSSSTAGNGSNWDIIHFIEMSPNASAKTIYLMAQCEVAYSVTDRWLLAEGVYYKDV